MKVIACIEDPVVIRKILNQLKEMNARVRFECPGVRVCHKRAYSGKENPFAKD